MFFLFFLMEEGNILLVKRQNFYKTLRVYDFILFIWIWFLQIIESVFIYLFIIVEGLILWYNPDIEFHDSLFINIFHFYLWTILSFVLTVIGFLGYIFIQFVVSSYVKGLKQSFFLSHISKFDQVHEFHNLIRVYNQRKMCKHTSHYLYELCKKRSLADSTLLYKGSQEIKLKKLEILSKNIAERKTIHMLHYHLPLYKFYIVYKMIGFIAFFITCMGVTFAISINRENKDYLLTQPTHYYKYVFLYIICNFQSYWCVWYYIMKGCFNHVLVDYISSFESAKEKIS